MKDLFEYGLRDINDFEYSLWELFDVDTWEKATPPNELFYPFLLIKHYPYSVSLLLKIGDNYKRNVFNKAGLCGNSKDWEELTKKLIELYLYDNSCYSQNGLFLFDSDDDYFCIYSEDIESVLRLALAYLIPICNDEKKLLFCLKTDVIFFIEDKVDIDNVKLLS